MNRNKYLIIFIMTSFLALSHQAIAQVTLETRPIRGGFDLDFGTASSLGPNGEPESDTIVQEVRVTITNPAGGRYQVFQSFLGPMLNERGEAMPFEAVDFFITNARTAGIVRFPNPTPIRIGEEEIFLSNEQGSNEEFIIRYTIHVPVGQRAGRYRTNVTFRVVSQ